MPFRPPFRKTYWSLIMIFSLFSLAIGMAGYFFYRSQKETLRQKAWDELGAIADLKVKEIVAWRKERIGDAGAIFNNPFVSQEFQKCFSSPKAVVVKREFLNWLKSLREHLQYDSVALLDRDGNVQVSTPEGQLNVGPTGTTLALEALRTGEIVFSDLYRSEVADAIRISLFVPLLISKARDAFPVGVLLLRMDPYQYLYPLIQSWPTSSRTAESLLVHREGDEGVFLNELRHRKDTALRLRFPLKESQLPAAMALRGTEGIVEGLDYRGIPVLAVVRRIPDSPWFLVSKVDQEEIYRPIHQQAWFTAVLSGLLIVGMGLCVAFLWRGQHLREHRRIQDLLIKTNAELEQRVEERTAELRDSNRSLGREIVERKQKEEALKASENQLRILSSRLLGAQEEERRRIARELHDTVGAALSAIQFRIDHAVTHSEQGVVPVESLEVLLPIARQAIEESRRMMSDLRPSMLDDLGIIATLGWFSRQFQEIYSGIRIEKKIEINEDEIAEPLKIVIFRIVQEALNNIAKHSKADLVLLCLRKTKGTIELTVQDNGQGFDPKGVASVKKDTGGLGLTSMRERAELSGGSFGVESSEKTGTVIRVAWSVEP